jgi:hypothetical protein
MVINFTLTPDVVLRVLLFCVTLLAAAGSLVEVAKVRFGHPTLYGFGKLFNLDAEATIPSYFSALLLLLAGCLLTVAAVAHHRHGRQWYLHWALLAAGFVYLSIDEAAGLHELLNRPARVVLRAQDSGPASAVADALMISGPWTLFGLAIVAAVGLFYLPFLLALPRRYALLFSGAGLLYTFGAVGFEATVGPLLHAYWPTPSAFSTEVVAEETCEMLGVVWFVYGLLDYLAFLGVSFQLNAVRAVTPPAEETQGADDAALSPRVGIGRE